MAWVPDGFVTPGRLDLPTGHHLRPIREADIDIDYPAVMGSRERLWAALRRGVGLAAGDDDLRGRRDGGTPEEHTEEDGADPEERPMNDEGPGR